MPLSRELHFIRANKTKFGGAERYLSRLTEALKKQNIDFQIVNSIFPTSNKCRKIISMY